MAEVKAQEGAKPKRLRGGETPRLPSAKETAELLKARYGEGADRRPGSIRVDANAATGEVNLVYVDEFGDETSTEPFTPTEPEPTAGPDKVTRSPTPGTTAPLPGLAHAEGRSAHDKVEPLTAPPTKPRDR